MGLLRPRSVLLLCLRTPTQHLGRPAAVLWRLTEGQASAWEMVDCACADPKGPSALLEWPAEAQASAWEVVDCAVAGPGEAFEAG